jgi:hypothetical protein
MQHICPRCHFSTKYRTHYVNHLERKQSCAPIYENIPIEELLGKMNSDKKRTHICDTCKGTFSHASSLSRHKLTHKINNEAPSIINITNNTNNTNSNNITNTNSNNITNNNINITINLTPFGEHSVKHVEEQLDFLTKSLKNILGEGIPDLIETIHLNPSIPENHNVKLHRIKHPSTMKVYTRTEDGECQWIERDMNTTLDQVIQGGVNILASHHYKKPEEIREQDKVEPDIFDMRTERLSKIKKQQRGVYGNVRNGVLCKFKENKETK